ncbi:WecB/TagA/CpsF family glycosyltransferase [Ornithinibacillus californiensis]|uniref:WecB/TagA/CpsF family glycosyltransferase n=1 Tax=Ornithinibacillus californiensis TaxID=161536 RepID=UPI000B1789D5|nr:WecB/TagA/CpsF family glycosyltransferase [Ornithinibacillus californiensis]
MSANRSLVTSEPMSRGQVSIMDIDFTTMAKDVLIRDYFLPLVRSGGKCFVVTANPEIVMLTREDSNFKEIVQSADVVVPDGAGIVLASKLMKLPIRERIPGFELMVDFLKMADAQRLSCYFLGAKEKVNQKFIREIQATYPNIKIAGYQHGYFQDDSLIVKQIKDSKPDFVFVAMGAPRQEEWIAKHYHNFSKGLFIGVGGSFDVIAGEVKRAPRGWIRLNLEWLYRLLKQPFRLKRFKKSIKFIFLVIMKRA